MMYGSIIGIMDIWQRKTIGLADLCKTRIMAPNINHLNLGLINIK